MNFRRQQLIGVAGAVPTIDRLAFVLQEQIVFVAIAWMNPGIAKTAASSSSG